MAYSVSKLVIWSGEIEDQVGGLSAKLEPIAAARADLQFVLARRQPHIPGKGIVFVGGVSGAKAAKAAKAAGLTKSTDLFALRVEAPNKPGDCYQLTSRLAGAGISLRGLTAGVIGTKYVLYLGFDSEAAATQAAKLIRAAAPAPKKRR